MAHQNNESSTTLPSHPPFATPLAPYIKCRQEALRIRQALTFYLRSHIVYADNDLDRPSYHAQSHLSLCVPNEAVVGVKRIPSEFTGLRKEYLQALQANVAARKEYELISEKATWKGSSGGATAAEVPPRNSSLELQAYLRLVRDRRRHAKLQVFQHYLQELREREVAKPEDFENKNGQSLPFELPDEFGEVEQNGGDTRTDAGELLHKLERAVIRAKAQLDKEKKLLEQLKARIAPEADDQMDRIPPTVRVAALQRTRDELVQWVEEKLVNDGNNDELPVQELPPEEIEESARILEEQKTRIMEQYTMYVDARKRLLDAASRACQPVSMTSTKSPDRSPENGNNSSVEEALPIEPLEVLSFASDVLQPLSKTHRSLALQKFYLSAMFAKEKDTTLRILNRLNDESHLLPEYPILARQPRFKHVAAAIGSRHATNQVESTKPDEIVSRAEAWAFASEAAGSGEKEYLEKKVVEGSERAEEAEHLLQQVYDLLNQDLQEALKNDDHGETKEIYDIWAYEAQSVRARGRPNNRAERRTKGPWTHLNGKVGLTD